MTHDKSYYQKNKAKHRQQVMANTARYIARNQKIVLEYLKLHPCVDCGESDPIVLEFDHVVGEKKTTVANLVRIGASVKMLMEEIVKCVVRCANCHRRKTALERNWFRASQD